MTLLEVARSAGVSTATVARVIYSNGSVSKRTRARVEAVLRETGYRPNVMARALRKQRSFTLGHMLVEITQNPFYAHVARSVEGAALDQGYKTFAFNHAGDPELERIGVDRFIERRVDAMLLTYAEKEENVELFRAADIPVVQIERERARGTHAVLVDSVVGVTEAMAHLIELGHRRIAFIGGDPALYPDTHIQPRSVEEQRIDGYLQALRQAGISVRDEWVRLGLYFRPDVDRISLEGYRATHDLLKLPERPTAIVTGCDMIAVGALQALYEAGLRVPDDISLIGFDDTLARCTAPMLTSVAQPMEELGREAVRLALDAIDQPDMEPVTVTLPARLVIRESTGAPPGGASHGRA